jgi:predicted deacetylase
MNLLVAFHDVSALNFEAMGHFLNVLEGTLGQNVALMAIPHSCNHDATNLEFGEWLTEKHSQGSELFIHGLTHSATPEYNRNLWGRFANSINKDEAEFAGLNLHDSALLLEQARLAWNELKAPPALGFCPPTWFGNAHLEKQVLAQNLVYEGRLKVSQAQKSFWSFPLSLLADSPQNWERSFKMGVPLLNSPIPNIRIVIHPCDVRNTAQWNKWVELIHLALSLRTLRTYGELLGLEQKMKN